MQGYRIAPFEERHRSAVTGLWAACGLIRPWNDPDKDIDRKLTDPVGQFLLVLSGEGEAEEVLGSVMVGYDGHRGSIFYLAVHPDHQSAGLGRRRSNTAVLAFYDRLGFAEDDAVLLGKRLIPDT
ncbi:GNAT family N-acetyltransferase [Roseibium suaedae]|uniref:Ribosomal protein S18 acetylase RimI n=1 Tax=Roseibium suaedae TaxID=735517 RepID=A0A1M7KUI9_9HYPH|nr:GNAT family N-acetyltransferase [Roseibium suaedae]SHM69246.1 Ribosomal protein S18 acetylase RimI [Roseibium suaedae]